MPDDGGPAFPQGDEIGVKDPVTGNRIYTGMSLRDWFAGQALAGLLTDPTTTGTVIRTVCEVQAEVAYAMADAMLAARGREGK